MSKCSFIKPDGERCRAIPKTGEEWCYAHNPAYEEKRRRDGARANKRGGRGRRKDPSQMEARRLTHRLEALADMVLESEVEAKKAAIVGQLLNYCLRGVQVEIRAREVEELAAEVQELREIVGAREEQGEFSQWG